MVLAGAEDTASSRGAGLERARNDDRLRRSLHYAMKAIAVLPRHEPRKAATSGLAGTGSQAASSSPILSAVTVNNLALARDAAGRSSCRRHVRSMWLPSGFDYRPKCECES